MKKQEFKIKHKCKVCAKWSEDYAKRSEYWVKRSKYAEDYAKLSKD